MGRQKHVCKCAPKLEKVHKYPKNTDCKNVEEIIESLTAQAGSSNISKRTKVLHFKMKPFKPPHFKDTCVPMTPSMHTRLRYISQFSLEHNKQLGTKKERSMSLFDFGSMSEGEEDQDGGFLRKKKKNKTQEEYLKRVRYNDLLPRDVIMPVMANVIKHTDSDKSIFNVPSPNTSGDVIPAEKAATKSVDYKPPLPSQSGYDLFKPHSGIIVNKDNSFLPNVNNIHWPTKIKSVKTKLLYYKGGVCPSKACVRKICRKHLAALRRKQSARQSRSSLSISYRVARDGKPWQRGVNIMGHDDEVCTLDDIPRPEHVKIPPNLKRGTLQTHSLTVLPCTKDRKTEIQYGILTGSFNMYDAKFSDRSKGRQALALSVMAYCLAFHYHPKQWTMKLIDNLIMAGDQWYIQCLNKVHDHSAFQGMCEVLPFGKKQTLFLNSKKMQVLLGEPDVVGYTMSLDPTVYNLCRGLKAFFQINRAGILLTRILKLVIWKDRICFYIFDPAGRDARAYSNFANGCSALINVKDVVSVAEVLLARSILENQKFVLAPVKVLRMVDEKDDEDFESDKELTQAEKAMMGYRILNENLAIVNANMHLGDRCFEGAKFRQALPIAIVAMTYSKISPPNTWFSKTLDKILRLGNKLYMDCLHPKVMIDMTIDNIPNVITIGPYDCEIIIYRERIKGQLFTKKECLLNIRTGLNEFFSHNYNSGILEFNNYALAIWRQKDMYYLFDPYSRAHDGTRSADVGKACCLMLLNPESMAAVFTKNWEYLPATTHYYIHAFKVLKLKKRKPKSRILCTLSDEQLPGTKKIKRKVLPMSKSHGDGKEIFHDVLPMENIETLMPGAQVDEEQMGDIISLVDSIQEDYLPPIPLKYKNLPPEQLEEKVVNLDSPTVSVTQVVPPWPKPRDKTNELPDPDPDSEPPTPPTPLGNEEENEEEIEEEEDEERMKKKKEEEARRKAEQSPTLPPPLPPPPSPQPEPEVEVTEMEVTPIQTKVEELEVQVMEPVNVEKHILLTEDAKYRYNLRQLRNKMIPPLIEKDTPVTVDEELEKPSNFKNLPDSTQIIRGTSAITGSEVKDVLPFGAIMAIVTSYKYAVNTWTVGIVNFVIDTAKKLYENKQQKFQMEAVHIIPKIVIGHQAYHAKIDVVGEGSTWQLEEKLARKFLPRYDRGMITTSTYSCAIFKRNNLYYLYDASSCNAMGLRDGGDKGTACFLRFRTLHDLVARVGYNKNGKTLDQHFILSRVIVRRLLTEPRMILPKDYDFDKRKPKSNKSKLTISKTKPSEVKPESKSENINGYQNYDGVYRIEGTTGLKDKANRSDVKSCHFVSLIAMLMATMHPIRTWNQVMVDTCIEKGLEIKEKAKNLNICEKRVIKNVILDNKFINVNIKKIIVVNQNREKQLCQYLKAVLKRLRYVIIYFPSCSMVICKTDGYYHLFDPYENQKDAKGKQKSKVLPAGWTLCRSINSLNNMIIKYVNSPHSPEFYTFELTSIKRAPHHSALNYRLSPLFKPVDNPNVPYLKRRKIRPIVDEKMYWLNIETVPWSRMNCVNDLGFERKTPRTMWKDWDIEFPGDLFSLWGSLHPMDQRFDEENRGKQYLATSVVALVMTKACNISAWTSNFLDGIVEVGDKYHTKCRQRISSRNHEISLDDLSTEFEEMYPYKVAVKFENIIFGFVYNIYPDRFNLSKALVYFFEESSRVHGILTSTAKNLAFGRFGASYFMFDCQSYGSPVFCPGQGASYILKCESLNRLIYCMAVTLDIRRHGQQFHLFNVNITLTENTK